MEEARRKAAMERLNINESLAQRVIDREVGACEGVVVTAQAEWESHECRQDPDDSTACEHLLRLWLARDYLKLARNGAPKEGAWPCMCEDGRYYSGGAIENGRYTGKVGDCFRCRGKGWQSEHDRKRNENYDRYYRRIHA